MRYEQIYPGLAAVFAFVFRCVLAPLGRCGCLGLYLSGVHFVGGFGFADKFCRAGFDYKVRFVGGTAGQVDMKVTPVGFKPFLHLEFVFQYDGEPPLGIGVKLLGRLQAL